MLVHYKTSSSFVLKLDDLILVHILYPILLPVLQSPHNMHSSNLRKVQKI